MRHKLLSVLAFAGTLGCAGSPASGQLYQVHPIEGAYVYGRGLNERNQVVGYVKPNGTWSGAYAFLWNITSGLVPLGGYSAADINDRGQMAGNLTPFQAAVWENGHWLLLENRQGAEGINNQGQVTGLISAQPSIPGPYAPYRDDDIHTPGFVTLQPPYPRASHGYAINNRGQVVADCGTELDSPNCVSVFYDSDNTRTILDHGGYYESHPLAINDRGQIVGYGQAGRYDANSAVFWNSPEGPIQPMGSLGAGFGLAHAINNIGEAVGTSGGRAFIWSVRDGMRDLNEFIDPSLEITLTWATAINDRGAIVAWGLDAVGQERSLFLTPPLPGTVGIDIRPRSCPNPLNVNSRGHIPVAVLGSPQFEITSIDLASIRLAGVGPVHFHYRDYAAPPPDPAPGDCTTAGPDGNVDLLLHFDTQQLVEALLSSGAPLFPGRVLTLHLTASLVDGSRIEGVDCIVIRGSRQRPRAPIKNPEFLPMSDRTPGKRGG